MMPNGEFNVTSPLSRLDLLFLQLVAPSVQPQKSTGIFFTKYFVKKPFLSITNIVMYKRFFQFRSTFKTTLSVLKKKISREKQNETEWNKPNFRVKESSNIKPILHENQMQGSRIAGDQGGKVRIHLILEGNLSHGLQNLPS